MKSRRSLLVLLALVAGAAFVWRIGHRRPAVVASHERAETAVAEPAGEPARLPAASPPAEAVAHHRAPARATGRSEAALMAELRALGAADPAHTLALAREGNRRFPDTADAAERSWAICKSLAALGRASEARDEAQRMVERYPDTEWANDVRHHLLTQPLQHPEQRGYGKSSELE